MKNIIKRLDMVKGGFGWHVGNGASVFLWFDVWLITDLLYLVLNAIDRDELTKTL